MPPSSDIVQIRRDALDRSHDLIRLSGVEFAILREHVELKGEGGGWEEGWL
jgi:hypothetical protein